MKVEEWKTGGQVKETLCYYCQDSLLKFSSKGLNLGLELEIIDKQQEVGNGEEEEAEDEGHK